MRYWWNDKEVSEEEYQELDALWLESTKKDPPAIVAPEKKSRNTKSEKGSRSPRK